MGDFEHGTETERLTDLVQPLAHVAYSTRRRAIPSADAPPGWYLALEGSDEDLLLSLSAEPMHLGRGFGAHVLLDDQSVSRRHAIVVMRGGRPRILDDRSTNGTFVNGRRVSQAELTDGDVIVVGRVMLRCVEVARRPAALGSMVHRR
jgi:FHA domain-containing protein